MAESPVGLRHGDRLLGKVAIVTGAGHDGALLGTGCAISMLFAAQGALVALMDISVERAENTQDAIRADGGEAAVIPGDVTSDRDCSRVVDATISRFGRLDVLVNNAGIVPASSATEGFDEDDWDRVLSVNLKGPMLMSNHAVPHLAAASNGAIVNISSIAGMRGMGVPSYAASKAGLLGLTRDLAYSLGRRGVRVNCIAPGHVHGPAGRADPERNRELRRRAGMLGTEGTAWDVAWATVFLASDESRWITGALLPVDAGATQTTALPMHRFMTE